MSFADPSSFTNPLRRFARTLGGSASVEVAQPLPLPESRAGQSHLSVERAVATLGGERVDGWRLQEWPGVALRAEYVAAWRDGSGRLWHVQGDDGNWLFQSDPQPRARLSLPLPRYQALSRDVLVEDLLQASQARDRSAPGSDARVVIGQTVERLTGWLALQGSGDVACPCGSGRRYANCCSRRLRDSLAGAR